MKNQTEVTIKIFEGDHELTSANVYLGSFTFNGLEPKKKGE